MNSVKIVKSVNIVNMGSQRDLKRSQGISWDPKGSQEISRISIYLKSWTGFLQGYGRNEQRIALQRRMWNCRLQLLLVDLICWPAPREVHTCNQMTFEWPEENAIASDFAFSRFLRSIPNSAIGWPHENEIAHVAEFPAVFLFYFFWNHVLN